MTELVNPSRWQFDRLKWSTTGVTNGVWGEEPNGIDDIPCARVADFDRVRLVVSGELPTLRAVTERERANRVLRRGDLLIEKSGGGDNQPVGCVVSYERDDKAICSNFIGRMPPASEMHPRYWAYVHAWIYSTRQNIVAIKQTTGIQNLDIEAYLDIRVPYPSTEEQAAVAEFLDRETARLENLVTAKSRVLGLLAEKRKAIIATAVTRGLDPKVKLRDSGVAWLGELPAHWNVTRLKFVANVQTGVALGKDYNAQAAQFPYLRVANVQDGFIDLTDVKTMVVPEREAASAMLRSGDVLMNEGGDADKLGRGAIWDGSIDPCLHQNHVFALRPTSVTSAWLSTWTGADFAKAYFETRAKQSTNLASISSTNLLELPIAVPTDYEQRAIVEYIARETAKLDAVRAATERTIALLKERRAALIAAAVTGQLDVGATA